MWNPWKNPVSCTCYADTADAKVSGVWWLLMPYRKKKSLFSLTYIHPSCANFSNSQYFCTIYFVSFFFPLLLLLCIQHDESIRRHMEQIEQRKEKAAELSSGRHANTDYAPKLTPYERKKQCSLCNVMVSQRAAVRVARPAWVLQLRMVFHSQIRAWCVRCVLVHLWSAPYFSFFCLWTGWFTAHLEYL